MVFNAVTDIESCKLAYYSPATDLEGVIADLLSSLEAIPAVKKPILEAHFVDIRFRGDCNSHDTNNKSVSCFVCKRKGCLSTNHSKEKRTVALKIKRSINL